VEQQGTARYSFGELKNIVRALRPLMPPGTVVALRGLLGAGKTAFVQEVCRELGVASDVVSPTYSYVSVYPVAGVVIYHFDLYRISGIEEFESLGFLEYLSDPRGIALIEWPERVTSLLERAAYAPRVLEVALSYVPEESDQRQIRWKAPCVEEEGVSSLVVE